MLYGKPKLIKSLKENPDNPYIINKLIEMPSNEYSPEEIAEYAVEKYMRRSDYYSDTANKYIVTSLKGMTAKLMDELQNKFDEHKLLSQQFIGILVFTDVNKINQLSDDAFIAFKRLLKKYRNTCLIVLIGSQFNLLSDPLLQEIFTILKGSSGIECELIKYEKIKTKDMADFVISALKKNGLNPEANVKNLLTCFFDEMDIQENRVEIARIVADELINFYSETASIKAVDLKKTLKIEEREKETVYEEKQLVC